MTFADILTIIYCYRQAPDPAAVAPILDWTWRERLLQHPDTQIAWSGVVTALYDRHPEKQQIWTSLHGETINRAFKIAKSLSAPRERQWADYLLYRWLILAGDKEAWTLLLRAHHPNASLAAGAQACIDKVCMGTQIVRSDGRPVLNSQGTVQGNLEFPDLRAQIIELTKEFQRMTWKERNLPWDFLPWSPEFRLSRDRTVRGLIDVPVSKLPN